MKAVWLCLLQTVDNDRVLNTHVIIDSEGQVRETYSKTHLFDLDIEGQVRLCESDYTVPGNRVTPPVKTPAGNVGMEIVSFWFRCCLYDCHSWCIFLFFLKKMDCLLLILFNILPVVIYVCVRKLLFPPFENCEINNVRSIIILFHLGIEKWI